MREKIENFFYYYKFHIIAVIFALIVVIVLVTEDNVQEKEPAIVIVDDSSQMSLTRAGNLMKDFANTAGLSEEDVAFYYRSMYLEQENFQGIAFDIAGVEEYYDYIVDGRIDFVLKTTADFSNKETETESSDTQETVNRGEISDEQMNEAFLDLSEYFSEEELKTYEKKIYFVEDKPVGIIFSNCQKAKEFFEDDYPTEYHYILQISKGAKEDANVRAFVDYLLTVQP